MYNMYHIYDINHYYFKQYLQNQISFILKNMPTNVEKIMSFDYVLL